MFNIFDYNQYRSFLLSNIIPWATQASGDKEINCRCFYCQDSKAKLKGHFYISIPHSDKELSYYYCQKCGTCGIVSSAKLMEWGIYDSNISYELTIHNKHASKYASSSDKLNSSINRLSNKFITDDAVSLYKLKYINDRLGLNLNYQDLLDNKVVLNIGDVLKYNHITEYTRHANIMKQLDECFLGFISYDNSFINLRNLNQGNVYKTIDKKYVNYNIFGKYDNAQRYYVSPAKIDLYNIDPVQIHIAEGGFDIMSIKYNLRKEFQNSLYASICGSGYKGLCRNLIITAKFVNADFHIYPDKDIDRDVIIDIAEYLKVFKFGFYIHRNLYTGEKDFGVDISHIKESIEKIM